MNLKRYWFQPSEIAELSIKPTDGKDQRFISQRAYQSLRPDMDNVSWNETFRNKLSNVQMFRANGIPSARFLGFLNNRDGSDAKGNPLTSGAELVELIRRENVSEIALKHVVGGTGFGVWLLTIESGEKSGEMRLRDGRKVGVSWLDELIKGKERDINGYVVEEVVRPHVSINEVTGGGLFSVRLLSLRKRDGSVVIQGGMARFGRVSGLTDHGPNGGLYSRINLNSGITENAIQYRNGKPPIEHEGHPDTGRRLVGFSLPWFSEAISLTKRTHKVFPGVHFVGWDVLLGEDGPLMLEGNVGINVAFTQNVIGGFGDLGILDEWKSELGCRLPDGSRSWRISHYICGRRLTPFESFLASCCSRLSQSLRSSA